MAAQGGDIYGFAEGGPSLFSNEQQRQRPSYTAEDIFLTEGE